MNTFVFALSQNKSFFTHPKRIVFLLIAATVLFSFVAVEFDEVFATTGINQTINFQGKVVNSDGTNVADGNYNFVFRLYKASSGGTAQWTESWNSGTSQVEVNDGIFHVALGTHTSLSSLDFNDDSWYLSVEFNGDGEMDPRIRFASVPYALNAKKVSGLTVTDTTGTFTLADGKTLTVNNTLGLSGTDGTTFTFPNASDTVVTLTASQTLTNKTIGSTGLVFSGASTDITTAANEDLTITANGTGDIILVPGDGSGYVEISSGDLRLTGISSNTSTTEGTLYYDTDDDQLKVYANGKWQADRSTATVIVAASDTRNKEKADFVADGTDDDATIESAIAALPSGGGSVVLLEGTYSIGDTAGDGIDITKSNVSIVGTGRATILQRAGQGSSDGVIVIGDGGTTAVTGVKIHNLSIDGQNATYTAFANYGIEIDRSVTYVEITNSYLHSNEGYAIYSSGSSGNVNHLLIQGNEIRNNDSYGIYFSQTTNSRIVNNNLSSNSYGVNLDNSSVKNTVDGNTMGSNTLYGILVNTDHNIISNNVFSSNGNIAVFMLSNADYNTVTGNMMSDNFQGIQMAGLYNAAVGNTIYNSSGQGIQIEGNNNTIEGNTITEFGAGYNGIYLTSDADNNIISNNAITDSSGSSSYGIKILANSDNNFVSGNEINGAGLAGKIDDAGSGNTIQQRDGFEIEGRNLLGHLLNISGESVGKSLFNLNYTGIGQDIFTASASGTAKFAITNSGGIRLGTDEGDSGECLLSGGVGAGATWGSCGGGGSSLFTDGGTTTYLTSVTDDLAIGGTDSTAPFFFDVSAGLLTLTNTTAGNSFRVNDTSGDTTPFIIDEDGNVGVGVADPLAKLHIDADGSSGNDTSAGIEVNVLAKNPIISTDSAKARDILSNSHTSGDVSLMGNYLGQFSGLSNYIGFLVGQYTVDTGAFHGLTHTGGYNTYVGNFWNDFASSASTGPGSSDGTFAHFGSESIDFYTGELRARVDGQGRFLIDGSGGYNTGNGTGWLDVQGPTSGVYANAITTNISGQSARVSLAVNNNGSGDILTASSSGVTKFTINKDGQLYIADSTAPGTTTNMLYADSGNLYWNGVQLDTAGGASLFTDNTTYISPNTISGSEFRIWDGGGLGLGSTTDPGAGNLILGNGTTGGELFLTGKASSASTTEGTLYYDTDDDQLKVYANGKWQADRSTATVIVAASDTRNKEKADFVADGTDDDATIESAIAALPTGGGSVILLEGNYYLGSSVNITTSNVTLTGTGRSTTLIRNYDESGINTGGMIMIGDGSTAVSRVAISRLYLNGNRGSYTSINNHGVLLRNNITDSELTDLIIENSSGEGIKSVNSTSLRNDYITISGNTIQNNSLDGIDLGSANSFFTIKDNKISRNNTDGIFLQSTSVYASSSAILNNIITHNGSDGMSLNTGSNFTISGNKVEDNSAVGIYFVNAITNSSISDNFISDNGQYGLRLHGNSNNNSVHGNTVSNNAQYGIYVTSSSNNNAIIGNIVSGNSFDGIQIAASNNTVTGNTVSSNAFSGIYVLGSTSNYNNISGNQVISNTQRGIYLNSGTYNLVDGNKVYENGGSGGTYDSIYLFGADNNTISNNDIYDSAGSTSAIELNSTSDNNILSGNTYDGAGASNINDLATNTIYNNQKTNSSGDIAFKQRRMGIGTTTPEALLHVNGGTLGGNAALIINQIGASTNDIFTASASGTTKFSITSAGGIKLGTNEGTSGQCLLSGGVGAGATWGSCGAGGGSSLFTDGGATTYLTSVTDDLAVGGTDSTAPFFFDESAELLTLTNTTAGNSFRVNDEAGDTTPFVVDENGNVGIGTSDPTTKLQLAGAGATNGLSLDGGNSKIYVDFAGGAIRMVSGNSWWAVRNSADTENNLLVSDTYIESRGKICPSDQTTNCLYANSTSQYFQNGNLGVGTDDAKALLHVVGGNKSGNAAFILDQTGASTNDIFTASASGSTRMTLSNGGGLTLTPGNPTLKGAYDTTGLAVGVAVSGRYAYVADYDAGLQIIDISNPASPTLIGTYNTSGSAYDVAVSGKYAYVADGSPGLRIIDISNPASPSLAGTFDTTGAVGVAVSGKYAYVADGSAGLRIIDISNPASPTLIGTYNTSGSANDVAVSGKYAYVADYLSGLQIIDISNPAVPTLGGTFDTTGGTVGVAVSGKYAYVADGSTTGLQIIDISNPASLSVVGAYASVGADGVAVSGKYAYVAGGSAGIHIIDISSLTTPTLVGSYDTVNADDIIVSGKYAYVADTGGGLLVFDINGIDAPAATIGGLEVETLNSIGDVVFGNNAYVQNGLNVGPGGILSQGALTVNSATSSANLITGAPSGQALLQLNYTGTDQDILTASLSGVTKFRIRNDGSVIQSEGLTIDSTDADVASGITFGNTSSVYVYRSAAGELTIGDNSGNAFTFDTVNGPSFSGSARPAKTITLSPEYPGAVISAFYGAGTDTDISGSMTSDIETTGTNNQRTYYQWERTTDATQHFYTVAVRFKLPKDFSAWASSNAITVSYVTESATNTVSDLDVRVYLESDSDLATTDAESLNNASTSWTTVSIDDSSLTEWNAAGEGGVIYLRMGSASSNHVRVGDIQLNYLASY